MTPFDWTTLNQGFTCATIPCYCRCSVELEVLIIFFLLIAAIAREAVTAYLFEENKTLKP